jgi:hypothetical protein
MFVENARFLPEMSIQLVCSSSGEHHANLSRPIVLATVDRQESERLQRSPSAQAVLMAQDVAGADVARQTGYVPVRVSRIRRLFAEAGIAGLIDRARSGRPRR